MSNDAIILMALALFVCGFLVTQGALELLTLILVPASVGAVLAMKMYFPPELLMLAAGAVLIGSLLSFKDNSLLMYGAIVLGLVAVVFLMKMFLPVVVITRLALSIIFLGLIKLLVL
jgi:hypothetical protein